MKIKTEPEPLWLGPHGQRQRPIQIVKGLDKALWREKEKLAQAWKKEIQPTLERPLTSDAWYEWE